MFYVYAHIQNADGKIFYIGKGKGRRAYQKKGRGKRWEKVAAEDYNILILSQFPDEAAAFASEIDFIARFRKEGHPLINISIGGDGAAGHIHSDETKAKRAATLARPEIRKKLIEALPRGRNHHASKAVICVETGMRFESQSDATRWLVSLGFRADSPGFIGKVCKGKLGTAYGYNWEYADFDYIKPQLVEKSCKRSVICIETDTRFDGIIDAVAWLKSIGRTSASGSAISVVCSTKKTMYGFHWKYERERVIIKSAPPSLARRPVSAAPPIDPRSPTRSG